MQNVFITGANRGLDLKHARQHLDRGWRVTVTALDSGRFIDMDGETVPL